MKTLFFSLLAVCFAALGSLSAQSDKLIHIQKNYYHPETFAASLAAEQRMAEAYAAKGATYPMTAYVFDDHTIEFVWKVDTDADLDRLQDNYSDALMRMTSEERERLGKARNRINRKFFQGFVVKELSYTPEGYVTPETGPPIVRVQRYRFLPGNGEAVEKLAEDMRAYKMAKRSPLPFSFEIYPMGLDENQFEIVYWANSETELKEGFKTIGQLFDTDEGRELIERRQKLVEQVSMRLGKKDEVLSVTNDKQATGKTNFMQSVTEYKLSKADYARMLELVRYRKELSEKYYYPAEMRVATNAATGEILLMDPLRSYAELDRMNDRGDRMRAVVPKEEMEQLRNRYADLNVESETGYIYQHDEETSYTPAGFSADQLGERPYVRVTDYTYDRKAATKLQELLKERKALAVANNAPLYYEVNYYTVGGMPRTFTIAEIAKDKVTLEQHRKQTAKLLDDKKWHKQLEATLDGKPRTRTFEIRNDLKYTPRELPTQP